MTYDLATFARLLARAGHANLADDPARAEEVYRRYYLPSESSFAAWLYRLRRQFGL